MLFPKIFPRFDAFFKPIILKIENRDKFIELIKKFI